MRQRTRLNRASGTRPPSFPITEKQYARAVARGDATWATRLITPRPLYHGGYLFDLSKQSAEVILFEFRKMLAGSGDVTTALPGTQLLAEMQGEAMQINEAAARAVAGTSAPTWLKFKVIIWRGCWCLRLSKARNKRLKLPTEAEC